MNLKQILVESLRRNQFVVATPIQEEAIPVILTGVDVVARAKNGTGKTGAFSIPILERLDLNSGQIQAVILAHTKELAMQTAVNIKTLGAMLPGFADKVMCSIGGVEYREDVERLKKKPVIIVGTPARIRDFSDKGMMNLKLVKTLVLDEADKLIGQDGFFEDIVALRKTCAKAQALLFSATFPQSVEEFCDKYMEDPAMINCMQSNLTLDGVTQYIANVKEEKFKVKLLNVLFSKLQINQCIVFVNNFRKCEPLQYMIANDLKIPALCVHSKMDLEDRSRIFHDFSQGNARVLVTTDLYTRGIDIRTVNVVINFEVPLSSDDYLHRIGRCGRFGHKGLAITFMAGEQEKNRFLSIDNTIKGSQQKQINNLPADLSQIPVSIYAHMGNQLVMK